MTDTSAQDKLTFIVIACEELARVQARLIIRHSKKDLVITTSHEQTQMAFPSIEMVLHENGKPNEGNRYRMTFSDDGMLMVQTRNVRVLGAKGWSQDGEPNAAYLENRQSTIVLVETMEAALLAQMAYPQKPVPRGEGLAGTLVKGRLPALDTQSL